VRSTWLGQLRYAVPSLARGKRLLCCVIPHCELDTDFRSYFTTPEKYEAQHYEGASTLYGPAAGMLVGQPLVGLGRRPSGAQDQRRFSYSPGKIQHFALQHIGAPPFFPDTGLANILQDAVDGHPLHTQWHNTGSSCHAAVALTVMRQSYR